MSITLSKGALSKVLDSFQIRENDSKIPSITKFMGGSVLKTAVMALAGFEYTAAKMGSALPISSNLTEYANEAAKTFLDATSSLDRPFAKTTKTTSYLCGLYKKTEIVEGPTASSYIQDGVSKSKETASKHKGLIAAAVILTAAAITLYYFGPSLPAQSSQTVSQISENPPFQGPENMPIYGPENIPIFGPENEPAHNPSTPQVLYSKSPFLPSAVNNASISHGHYSLTKKGVIALDSASLNFGEYPAPQLRGGTRTDAFSPALFPESEETIFDKTLQWTSEKANQALEIAKPALIEATRYPISGTIAAGMFGLNPQNPKWAFTAGIVGTLIETIGIRGSNITGYEAPLTESIKNGTHVDFPIINKPKQLELKTFALASAVVPFLVNLGAALVRRQSIRNQFSPSNLAFYGTLTGLSLANSLYGRTLGLTTRSFDSSGHIMLKTALAPAVAFGVSKAAQIPDVGRSFATLFAGAYLITDGIFLKNTVRFYHSVPEAVAGLGWGASIIGMSWFVSKVTHRILG